MVVRFSNQQDRGQAGQSAMSGKSRNFANLYNMNRSGQQIDRQAAGMQQKANATNQDMSDAINLAKNPNRGVNNATIQNQMANAVQRARGISNQAQGFDPANEFMKNGASPLQAGIGSFYAGGKNSQGAQNIRKFSGLYQSTLDRATAAQNEMNKGIDPSTIQRPQKQADSKAVQAQSAVDQANNKNRNVNLGRGQARNTRKLSDLDWMLKTGRITTEDYYKAQGDDDYFDLLMKNNS